MYRSMKNDENGQEAMQQKERRKVVRNWLDDFKSEDASAPKVHLFGTNLGTRSGLQQILDIRRNNFPRNHLHDRMCDTTMISPEKLHQTTSHLFDQAWENVQALTTVRRPQLNWDQHGKQTMGARDSSFTFHTHSSVASGSQSLARSAGWLNLHSMNEANVPNTALDARFREDDEEQEDAAHDFLELQIGQSQSAEVRSQQLQYFARSADGKRELPLVEKLLVSSTKRARTQDECTNSGLSLCMYSNDKEDPSCGISTANTSSSDVQKSYGSFNYDVQSTEPAGADNSSPLSLDLSISLGAL